jgi:nucleoid DNA-binding protein
MSNYSEQDLKTAYQIVQQDLFNTLLTIKPGQTVKIDKLGKFTKKERKQRCG